MLFKESARIITLVEDKKGTVKTLILSSTYKNKKQLFAVVCGALRYAEIIATLLKKTQLLKHEKVLRQKPTLARVLVHEFLFGQGLHKHSHYQEAIMKNKAALTSELARLKVAGKVSKNEDLLSKTSAQIRLPRYVRVNLLKTTVEDVIQVFVSETYEEIDNVNLTYREYIELVRNLQPKQFLRDCLLPELLVFAVGTDLHKHKLYKSGAIILQDKASCLPAYILAPPAGSHVIDCCAAPGNKTTHTAAILHNTGRVFAFDKDAQRLASMRKLTECVGASRAIQLSHMDFLKVDPTSPQYSRVTHAIVDPSCSGSGIVSRLNELTSVEESNSKQRLKHLANFQAMILKHALSFPSMQQVVYSTCSIHAEENERVVEEVEEWCKGRYSLIEIIPELPGRGEGAFTKCVRMSPERDLTNGFFVACFRRTSACDSKHLKSTHVATYSDNGGDIQCDIQGDVSADGHQNVPKKRRMSSIPVNASAGKKRKTRRKRKRNGKSVTAEA